MEILNVYPKDIHVGIELSLKEIKALERMISTAHFFPQSEEEKEYAEIVAEHLWPEMKKIVEEIEKDGP